jgi:hypothetical protein
MGEIKVKYFELVQQEPWVFERAVEAWLRELGGVGKVKVLQTTPVGNGVVYTVVVFASA